MRTAITALFLAAAMLANATVIKVEKLQNYPQEQAPEVVDNYLFSTYYSNKKNTYNMRGFDIASAGGQIIDLKVNPAGYSFAMLYGKPGKTKVGVSKINSNDRRRDVLGLIAPTAISYTPDSRQLVVADNNKLIFLNSKTLIKEHDVEYAGAPVGLVFSPNGYYIAAISDGRVDFLNANTGAVRATVPVTGVPSVAFSASSGQVGILTPDGTLRMLGTGDFSEAKRIDGLGRATSLFIHPDENYAGMVADGNRIQFVNLFEPGDRPVIYDAGLRDARFLRDGMDNLYIAAATDKALRYRQVGGFVANYGLQLSQMVEDRMREWMKMRPGESELEYQQRMSEESIKQQRLLFTNEAATELALTAGLGALGEVTLGRYNPTDGTLIVSLGNMNDIYLKVPVEDMPGFGDGNNLVFSNHVYGLSPDNTFKLIYVDVYNPTNGKTYVFDNLADQNLDFLMSDDSFVSLDLIMQSNREDVILKTIKDEIMEQARAANLLSDHTTINVETHIEQDVNADGRRVNNYHVDFTYQVDAAGSATEDFSPGKFKLAESPAATSLMNIIKQAFSNEFAQYIVPGKALRVTIKGSADGSPINHGIAYDGSLGEYEDEPCYINGNLTTISVDSTTGIKSNEQLAFMRAQAMQEALAANLPELSGMDVQYRRAIDVAKEKGSEFRRIDVSLVFVDAFE